MKTYRGRPIRKNNRETAREPVSAAEIIHMIKAKAQREEENEMDKNFQIWLEEQENKKFQTEEEKHFHNFEEMDIALNSMDLHRSIMEEIEFENDPKILKDFFSERLGQVLEVVPDGIAASIDSRIKGLE
jgi:hypothetical protein